MVCEECQRLEDKMYKLGPYDPEVELVKQELIAHDNLANKLIDTCIAKSIKCHKRFYGKQPEILDIVLTSDAAGSAGLTHLPYRPFYSAEQSSLFRDNLLKVHTEFTMAHDYGA